MVIVIVVMLCHCTADVHRCKQREHVGLNGSNQQFDHIDKGHHQSGHHTDRVRFENED